MKKIQKVLFLLTAIASLAFSASSSATFPETLEGVVFIAGPGEARVRDFPVTSNLVVSEIGIDDNGRILNLEHDKRAAWPGDENGISANAWAFVKVGETWYAGTWEWMRYNNTIRSGGAMVGPKHLRFPPLSTFVPQVGEVYGLMVTPTVRGAANPAVRERTNVFFYRWGVGPADLEDVFPEQFRKPLINPVVDLLLDTPDVM